LIDFTNHPPPETFAQAKIQIVFKELSKFFETGTDSAQPLTSKRQDQPGQPEIRHLFHLHEASSK